MSLPSKDDGSTALHFAVQAQDENLVRYLIKNGAKMAVDTAGKTCSLSYDGKEVDTDCTLDKSFGSTIAKCHDCQVTMDRLCIDRDEFL